MRSLCPVAIVVVAAFAAAGLRAATVSAELTADETSVGVPVQLQVRVEGTTNVNLPSDLGIDGLQTQLSGRSTNVSIINGRMTTSGIFSYTVLPLREGTFEIPGIDVTADGRKQRTNALKLTVQAGNAAPIPVPAAPNAATGATPAAGNADAKSAEIAWGELIVPRQRIYAGEVVPAEVRFYFNGSVPFRLMQDEPKVNGEGFTFQKFAPPQQTTEEINGVRYNVLSFKTALTAVKSGEADLPGVSLMAVAQVPARAPRGAQDFFDQFFGGSGIPGFTEEREVEVKTRAGRIRVNALPAEGRPEHFTGAVGEFTVAAAATPTQAAAGDPVTLKVDVSGRGNFDAMGEPRLVDPTGWRAYPPTDKFQRNDTIGFSGTKTYEIPIVAQQPQTRTPVAEFSYFDPVKEKYFTVRTQPVAVQAAANPNAAPVAAAAETTGTPTATPAPDQGGVWLTAGRDRSWTPLARQPGFWVANAAAGLVLLAWVLALLVRRARSGPAAARAALVRERDRALSRADSGRVSDDQFYDAALAALAAQAKLTGEAGPTELVRRHESQGHDVSDLHRLLARADERKFSGGLATQLDSAERQRFARAVKEVCR